MYVKEVKARLISNSRKEKAIEIILKTFKGTFTASPPSGKSRGKNEVEPYAYDGIEHSLKRLQQLAIILCERNFMIKQLSDLTLLTDLVKKFEEKKGILGGNVHYALQTVFLKGAAADHNKPLWKFIHDSVNRGKKVIMPMPVGNCIGGGKHSTTINGKKTDFQEFLLIPQEKTFSKAVTINLKAYDEARHLLKAHNTNDEHAWQTDKTNEEVLELLKPLAKKYQLRLGLDVASSSFYKEGHYHYENKRLIRDRTDQIEYLTKLAKRYNLHYLEDPVQEEDISGYHDILAGINNKTQMVVGDDLTCTNPALVEQAIKTGAINAMIIKPNQIGNILKMAEVVTLCRKHHITMIFSHRSGETMDDAIADYCIGFGGHYIKTGITGRERLIKLKRIIDIEKSLSTS